MIAERRNKQYTSKQLKPYMRQTPLCSCYYLCIISTLMNSILWKEKGSVEKDISAFPSYWIDLQAAGSDKLSCQLYIMFTSWLQDLQRQKL